MNSHIIGFRELEDELNRVFSNARDKRLLKAKMEKLGKVVKHLKKIIAECTSDRPLNEPQPTVGDLFNDPAVREACIRCAEDPITLPEEALSFVKDGFRDLREEWIQRCKAILLEGLEKSKAEQREEIGDECRRKNRPLPTDSKWYQFLEPGVPEGVDVLQLATTPFHCLTCGSETGQLHFPDVLSHKCARTGQIGGQGYGNPQDWVAKALHDDRKTEERAADGAWNFYGDIYHSTYISSTS